jgi:segregation and condensation protein A
MDERETDPIPEPFDKPAFDPLQVSLPYFDGPLDLLLHLVRKQQLDINEVRLADLTEPYLAYVERIQELNLDQAGEFLAIAATLVWIKSKSLLPRDETTDELDPESVEELLLLRLQEYQRIKESARDLAGRDLLGRDVFPRLGKEEPDAPGESAGPIFQEVSLFNLLEAFRRVLEQVEPEPQGIHVVPERVRIEDKLSEMMAILGRRRQIHFHDLFLPDATRAEIVITFMALLELIRLKAIRVVQVGLADTILCQTTEVFDNADADWKKLVLNSITGADTKTPADQAAAPKPAEDAQTVGIDFPVDPDEPVGHG